MNKRTVSHQRQIESPQSPLSANSIQAKASILTVLALIFSIISPVIGITLSIIILKDAQDYQVKDKKLAKLGLIFSIIGLVLHTVFTVWLIASEFETI
ncbi:MAG: hypothetical protein OXF30_02685 [Candidatus Saccharibacteria bacterium]|nr:hypothetical protein [Candidatus Saccharibacteria bacterium]